MIKFGANSMCWPCFQLTKLIPWLSRIVWDPPRFLFDDSFNRFFTFQSNKWHNHSVPCFRLLYHRSFAMVAKKSIFVISSRWYEARASTDWRDEINTWEADKVRKIIQLGRVASTVNSSWVDRTFNDKRYARASKATDWTKEDPCYTTPIKCFGYDLSRYWRTWLCLVAQS